MKVIVKKTGWYGGRFYDQSSTEQEMPDGVAKQFLPPFGDQLEYVRATKQLAKMADAVTSTKTSDKG
ncbi:hypothetical protein [Bartonella apis]|uniref:hypothetical protein n=1 Tax=Bartonella apis TaxID=1686310 RepID=UPI0024311D14|nr:hypothetical protein [Bartonella apis]